MARSAEDRTRDPNSEGYNIFAYNWFGDRKVMQPFIDSVVALAPSSNRPSRIFGLGVGIGTLEKEVAKALAAQDIPSQLFLSDFQLIDESPQYDRLVVNNRDLPLEEDSIDIFLARSVTHYAPSLEAEIEVLEEIKRRLRPGGLFITQVPAHVTAIEAEIIRCIHALLPKRMNLMTREHTRDMLAAVFDGNVSDAPYQTSTPIVITRAAFTSRYGPKVGDFIPDFSGYIAAKLQHRRMLRTIGSIIRAVPPSERPNIALNGNDFSWQTPFHIFVCQKR